MKIYSFEKGFKLQYCLFLDKLSKYQLQKFSSTFNSFQGPCFFKKLVEFEHGYEKTYFQIPIAEI